MEIIEKEREKREKEGKSRERDRGEGRGTERIGWLKSPKKRKKRVGVATW